MNPKLEHYKKTNHIRKREEYSKRLFLDRGIRKCTYPHRNPP